MSYTPIDPQEVVSAYEETGLTPMTHVELNMERTRGCAIGALAMKCGAVVVIHDTGGHFISPTTFIEHYPQIARARCSFGVGFDRGFSGKPFVSSGDRFEHPTNKACENGYAIGKAVRERFHPDVVEEKLTEEVNEPVYG